MFGIRVQCIRAMAQSKVLAYVNSFVFAKGLVQKHSSRGMGIYMSLRQHLKVATRLQTESRRLAKAIN